MAKIFKKCPFFEQAPSTPCFYRRVIMFVGFSHSFHTFVQFVNTLVEKIAVSNYCPSLKTRWSALCMITSFILLHHRWYMTRNDHILQLPFQLMVSCHHPDLKLISLKFQISLMLFEMGLCYSKFLFMVASTVFHG